VSKKISKSTEYVVNLGNYENAKVAAWVQVDVDDYDDEEEAIEDLNDTIVKVLQNDIVELREMDMNNEGKSFLQALPANHYPVKKRRRTRR